MTRAGIILTVGLALWGVAFLLAGHPGITVGLALGAMATMGFADGWATARSDYRKNVRHTR